MRSETCSVARTLEIVGEPWALLILREAFQGLERFGEMQEHLGVSRPVLAQRLREMVDAGLLERVPYREEGQRSRHAYRLTQKGRDLYPVVVALREWGDRYAAGDDGPPLLVTHAGCGAPVRVQVVCEDGHVVSGPGDVERRPGPGARLARSA
jgi:DNA-binding HxlR family transcriptional regulator